MAFISVGVSLKENRCEKARRSCPRCFTDYELVIHGGFDVGWKVMLKTYHRLGQCRTMDDIWLSFNSYPCSTEEDIDMDAMGFNTIYYDREGVEVIPFSRPYYNNSPHIPAMRHNNVPGSIPDIPILEGLEQGQMRNRYIQALGEDQSDESWSCQEHEHAYNDLVCWAAPDMIESLLAQSRLAQRNDGRSKLKGSKNRNLYGSIAGDMRP
jgi:hypothetical protein